jgi:hypothetical protein
MNLSIHWRLILCSLLSGEDLSPDINDGSHQARKDRSHHSNKRGGSGPLRKNEQILSDAAATEDL